MNRLTTWPFPEGVGGGGTPVRGREEELAFVEARLDALARGAGGIVLVEGPAGIGRSRLLVEASAAAKRRGTRAFQGGADPDEQFVPLSPLLDGLFAGEEPLSGADRLRDLAATPGQRFWLLQELGDRLREAARNGPLLIVLDDLQWCDELTLLTFHTLAGALAPHPILWLVAVRHGSVPPRVRTTLDRIRQAGAHELVLGPLGDPAVARIAEDALGAVPDPGVLRVARRAEGVPQLLKDLLDALRDEGLVTIENGTARLPAGPLPLPRLPSVAGRLTRLPAPTRELVETAAAVGRPVTVQLLAELLGRSPAALIGAVQESLDSGLLVERDDRLEFRHELIREAVEAGLPPTLRATLRGHAAEVPPARTASPVAPSAPVPAGVRLSDRTAVERLRAAAADLAATAPEAAAELSLRALELTMEDPAQRPKVIAETLPLLWQMGQPTQAHDLGASALAAGDLGPDDEARIRLAMARLASHFDFAEAVRQARAGAALPGIPAALRARLLALLCLGLSLAGDPEGAERTAAEAREATDAARDGIAQATMMVVDSALCFYRMDWNEALRRASRAAALAAGLGITPSVWIPEALWQCLLLTVAGRTAEALALADAGVHDTRHQGRAAAARLWLMHRARALLDAGRLAEARAEAEAAADMRGAFDGGDLAELMLLYTLTRVAIHTDDREAAQRCAAQARRVRGTGAPLARSVSAWMLVQLADFDGRPDRALAELHEVLAALAEERPALVSPVDPMDTPALVRTALRAGASERAAPAVEVAERRAARNPDFTILAASAAHARGLLDNDLAHLLRAVRLYEGCSRPIARASALEDVGRKLATTRRPEAVPYLDKALVLYTQAGAERHVARVRRRLRAAGVRRRPSPAGSAKEWPELTASELRVARLVAQGLTNPQVAEQLSLSPHTVGSHLRRAYTKLDIASRAELARLVERRDSGE
ncbi:AAA family ATPase [Kitasatospora sp. NPDC058170]|uniref:helix-turn-helix transcriptional regulator n=1 Tax=Kitasatospora sp. NPDC058170 TaxID=3346364 RepID=UPI0036DB9D80